MAQLAARIARNPHFYTPLRDDRGVVYVEFLIAFVPVFLLFLGICQLVLLTAARVVVSHAAMAGVRSAIVVLEDTADDYAGAPRGNLSEGKSSTFDAGKLLSGLGIPNTSLGLYSTGGSNQSSKPGAQQGARMTPIRLAAVMPLLTLAPKMSVLTSDGNLEQTLVSNAGTQLIFAYDYAIAASAVTIQKSESSDELAVEPIDSKGPVTVEVNYLYRCGVPIVRALACRSLSRLLDTKADNTNTTKAERLSHFAKPQWLSNFPGGYYAILTARATLTNQGAAYVTGNGS